MTGSAKKVGNETFPRLAAGLGVTCDTKIKCHRNSCAIPNAATLPHTRQSVRALTAHTYRMCDQSNEPSYRDHSSSSCLSIFIAIVVHNMTEVRYVLPPNDVCHRLCELCIGTHEPRSPAAFLLHQQSIILFL